MVWVNVEDLCVEYAGRIGYICHIYCHHLQPWLPWWGRQYCTAVFVVSTDHLWGGGGYNWLTIRIQTNKESQLKYHKTWHLYSHNLFEYLTFLSQICTESECVYIKRSNTEPEWYHWKTVREYLPHTHLCLILILHQSTHVSENITTHIHVTCWHGKETEICMVCWIDMSIMQVLIMLPLCFLTI